MMCLTLALHKEAETALTAAMDLAKGTETKPRPSTTSPKSSRPPTASTRRSR